MFIARFTPRPPLLGANAFIAGVMTANERYYYTEGGGCSNRSRDITIVPTVYNFIIIGFCFLMWQSKPFIKSTNNLLKFKPNFEKCPHYFKII